MTGESRVRRREAVRKGRKSYYGEGLKAVDESGVRAGEARRVLYSVLIA